MIALLIIFISNKEINIPSTCVIIESGEYSTCSSKTNIRIKGEFGVGDVVYLVGQFSPPSGRSNPFGFDYQSYLKGKNIYYDFYDQGSYVIGYKLTLYEVRDLCKDYINTFDGLSKKYLQALVLGDKGDFEVEELEMFSQMGISHLFAISGLHVGLLCIILEKLLPFRRKELIISTIVLVYMLIAGFAPSITRAGSMYILIKVLGRFKFTSLDCLSVIFIGLYILNQNVIYDVGFQLSFLVTFALLITKPKSLLEVSIIAQVITLPIIINMYNQLNVITIFVNVYFVVLMSFIVLPMTFAQMIIRLDEVYDVLIKIFEQLIIVSNEFNMIISIPNMHPLLIGIYYLTLPKIKVSVLLIVITLLTPLRTGIYFIDVGQGDSTLIVDEFVYLIDTGGKDSQNITEDKVFPVLRSLGINSIDYLILTHDHYDHTSGYETLIESFNVKNVVVSKHANFKRDFDGRIIRVDKGDKVGMINIMGPSIRHNSVNNQSLQMYFRFGKSFYMMGDSELKETFGEVDVLILGHHGSKTSLSKAMFDELRPSVTIASLGKNNYGIPSKYVLDIVANTKLFRTDIHHTIYFDKERGFMSTVQYRKNILGYR